MRVHITDVRTGDVLAEDVFNLFGLHVLSKGVVLTATEVTRLFQHRIDYLTIERRESSAPELPASEPAEPTDGAARVERVVQPVYQDAVSACEELFRQAVAEGRIDEEDVDQSFQPLVNNIRAERDVVQLLLILGGQDDYTYQHSVQVGMLSFYIAKWLGWSEEETVRAGKAGFLHDIGKCRIPDDILNKPGKLTDEEFREIRMHPQYGYEIIRGSFTDEAISLAALQHHERMDGRGYPAGLRGPELHPVARIVAVADVYSAMITSRVYREKQDLLHVLRELYRLSFTELDPHVTHTFIRHMVPNFIGKKADISNGQTGTIIMTHPSDFFHPLIRIGDEFIDLTLRPDLDIVHVHL